MSEIVENENSNPGGDGGEAGVPVPASDSGTVVEKPRHRRNRSSVDEVLSENKEEAQSLGIQVKADGGAKDDGDDGTALRAGSEKTGEAPESGSLLGALPPLKKGGAESGENEPLAQVPEDEEVYQTRRLFGSMWSRESFYPPSPLDIVLNSPECTLEKVMAEDDIFQEIRRSNGKLIAFLMLPANVLKIIDFATMEEDDFEGKGGVEEGMDPASMLRYSYVSCALLCSDVGSITTAMFVPIDGDDGAAAVDPLGRLFECIKRPSLSLRVASNFEKIVESLLVSQRKQFLEWLVPRPENLKFFMQHIGNNSMSEIFRKVLHFADGGDINTSGDGPGVDLWDRTGGSGEGKNAASQDDEGKQGTEEGAGGRAHPVIAALIGKVGQSGLAPAVYMNVMETLVDIIVRSTGETTFMMMQRNEEPKNEATRLMRALDDAHHAKLLVNELINGWDFTETDGTRARLQVLSRWLMWVSHNLMVSEIEKRQLEDSGVLAEAVEGGQKDEALAQAGEMPPLVKVLLGAFKFFCDSLQPRESPGVGGGGPVPFKTTYGTATMRIGRVRVELIDLMCRLVTVPHVDVAKAVADSGFMGTCFEVLLNFEWCNIVHAKITRAIVAMCNDVNNSVSPDVYRSFFIEFDILKKILDVYVTNSERRKTRHYESGYMGHMHVIAASIVETVKILRRQGLEPGDKTAGEIILQAVENNNTSSEWTVFVDITLGGVIRVQTTALGNDNNYKAVASPKMSPQEFVKFVKDDLDLELDGDLTLSGGRHDEDDNGPKPQVVLSQLSFDDEDEDEEQAANDIGDSSGDSSKK